MEHAFDHSHFWNSLAQGGEQARIAIQGCHQLPHLQREAIVAQVFQKAWDTISELLVLESTNNSAEFNLKKDGLCVLMDSIPALVTTPEGRAVSIARIQAVDVKARDLMDLDILLKCDEVETQLKRANVGGGLKGVPLADITSVEELEKELGTTLPPEVIEKIQQGGGAILLEIRVSKKGS